ncbi:MAG: hypothetical protein AUK44_07750, partial [Porphyromonadaceae bacterium CG2_30_38_12]
AFVSDIVFESAQENVINEKYALISGNKKEGHNFANELILNFINHDDKTFQLTLRAYNNGMAFNYTLNNKELKSIQVLSETTDFKLPATTKSWIQAYNPDNSNTVGYEAYYTNGTTLDSLQFEKNGWSYAALFEVGKNWLFATEARLDGTSPASHLLTNELRTDSTNHKAFSLAYPLKGESLGQGSELATFTNETWTSPWRVFLVSDASLAPIVESQIVTSLNDKSQIADTEWMKPGLANWSWWAEPDSPKEYASLLKYIDFAAAWKIPYFLVDANWNRMQGGTIEQLIAYANSKNVGIWLWYNSGGKHNTVTEQPRDLMDNAAIRRAEFERIHKLGVKGVKIDFFLSDKQHIIKQYVDILKDAADYKLMANFHGCTLPRGWNRTYPNLMAMEAVRGGEYYMYDTNFPQTTVWYNTVLAFTRNLTGPMDYTSFGLSNKTYKHTTSYANELAQLIVFGSGVNHLVDLPQTYRAQPAYIQDFIAQYPHSAWDDFKFVSGYPGKDVVLARKSGNKWFLAGINGETSAKNMQVALSFLNKDKNYQLKIIADGADSDTFSYKETILNGNEALHISMLPSGGFVAVIE